MSHTLINRFTQARRASATIELAAFALFTILLVLLGTDIVNYMRSKLLLDQVAGTTASLVSKYQQIYESDFATLFAASQQFAGGVNVSGNDGATVITGFINSGGSPVVAWRRQAGNGAFSSSFGVVGNAPTNLPDGYGISAGSSVIAVEVFTSIHPWVLSEQLLGSIGNPTLRSVALFQPRAAPLSIINAGTRP